MDRQVRSQALDEIYKELVDFAATIEDSKFSADDHSVVQVIKDGFVFIDIVRNDMGNLLGALGGKRKNGS